MKANQRSTATSSSTFTHPTACAVPRSSPLLSSSFTPFYPRSQQHIFHSNLGYVPPHDGIGQVPMQHSDDMEASQNYTSSCSYVRGPKFYDHQNYASLRAEPSEVPWVLYSGNMWDGGAWQQWGDAVDYEYAEDDNADSANLFVDSLSYYTGSPALEQDTSVCGASNTTHRPVIFPNSSNNNVNESCEASHKASSSITGSAAMPNVFNSIIMSEEASSASMKLKESSLSSFRESSSQPGLRYGQDPAKCEKKEVANTFAGRKLDANISPSQVSMQTTSGFSSQAGECESKTYHAENVGGQKEGNVVVRASHNPSKEHVSADPIAAKHSFPASTSHSITTIDNPNLKLSAFSLTTGVGQEEVQSRKSVLQHASIPFISEQSMTLPKDVDSQALEQMNGSEGLHQDKINLSLMQSEDVGLCSNGPHLLVECIHNLAKVLLSSQSKPSVNALRSSDCFALENTICMLSHRLFQSSANEAIDPNSQQELTDSTKDFVVPGGLQKDFNQFASMKQSLSLEREFQNVVLLNVPKVTSSSLVGGDNENSAHKKFMEGLEGELRSLRGKVQKLQEEVAFERVESNATVSLYKNLWSEAEEALKVSKAEIREIKLELAGLKQELTNVECSGGTRELSNIESCTSFKQGGVQEDSNMATSSSQGVAAAWAVTEVISNTCGGRPKKDMEVLTSYFDPGISSNCKRTGTLFAKSDQGDPRHGNKASSSDHSAGKPCLKSTMAAAPNLEGDVARRLSLILSRQGLDLNKPCTDSSVEWPSGSSSILEPSSNEHVPPNKNYLVWSEASYLENNNKGLGCSIPNQSCQRKCASEVEDSCYGFGEGELDDGGMDVEEGIYQEEELEIICFKPGIGDNNFTYLKGEPEWEDVVVTVLDGQGFIGKETG